MSPSFSIHILSRLVRGWEKLSRPFWIWYLKDSKEMQMIWMQHYGLQCECGLDKVWPSPSTPHGTLRPLSLSLWPDSTPDLYSETLCSIQPSLSKKCGTITPSNCSNETLWRWLFANEKVNTAPGSDAYLSFSVLSCSQRLRAQCDERPG